MSRVGSKEIMIPDTVKVNMQDGIFMAEGPMGKLESPLNEDIEVNIEENIIKMRPKSENKSLLPFWGLQRNIVNNIIVGVSEGFSKKLEMNGVGYRATLKGKVLELMLGFSHPINYDIPEDISVSVDKQNNIEIKGPNKQLVGQTAAEIRSFRGPEPYKGKGIKYADEYINRKEGKKK
ncbi:50S ribosomal protein L6 [Pelagibacteraceae bacterium]|nr:50S ribosomal protein L6 [Pelagibacteraceae bacterium]